MESQVQKIVAMKDIERDAFYRMLELRKYCLEMSIYSGKGEIPEAAEFENYILNGKTNFNS